VVLLRKRFPQKTNLQTAAELNVITNESHMLKFIKLLLGVVTAALVSSPAMAELNLSATLNCTYQKGQFLDKNESTNVTNSKPLNWAFNGLSSEKPVFVSGGDTGSVFAMPMNEGVIIYIPHPTGTSVFTIWSTGESFWGKQSNIVGRTYSQQYIGSCQN
jgi:hypothetical protein